VNKLECSVCLFDNTIPGVILDNKGVCNFCNTVKAFENDYPSGENGQKLLASKIDEIRKDGVGRQYDCVIGVSGGGDSSYLLHLFVKVYGLRVLAVHFDNTWNTSIATRNIHKMCTKLNVDLYTHVVSGDEFDDLTLSFVKAGLRDIEVPTDIGFAATINKAAIEKKVKWRIDGHNFRTEGIAPLDWVYIDGRYMLDVYKKQNNKNYSLSSIPNLTILNQLYMWVFKRIKLLRPFYYLDITKAETRDLLIKEYDWKYYGGHHLDNLHSSFFHLYYFRYKWSTNTRIVEYSALLRQGLITKDEARKESSIVDEHSLRKLIKYYKNRHELSDKEFDALMEVAKESHLKYKNYKKTFETLRPFFYILLKNQLISQSFYEKYCLK